MIKILLPVLFVFAFVGQGCFAPAPQSNSQPEQSPAPSTEAGMDMEGAPVEGVTEGEGALEGDVLVFNVDGFNFGYAPNKITVQKGQKVRINLKSSKGFHDWVVDEFNASTIRINEGEEAMVEFVPNKVGTFEFYCSVGEHRANGMVGTLVVEEANVAEAEGGVQVDADAEVKL